MAEIQKGKSFSPGDLVEAADLNNLVDAATALKGIVMDQPSTAPVQADDSVVFFDFSADNLARCKISALPNGVTSIDLTAIPTSVFKPTGGPITTTGTLNVELKPQTGNKVLIAPADGTSNTPSFRALVPADITPPTIPIAATNVDWSLGNVFQKALTASTTFTFSNVEDGQTIRVRVKQNATGLLTAAWNATPYTLEWTDGVTPDVTNTPNGFSIFVFTAITASSTTRIHGRLERAAETLTASSSFTDIAPSVHIIDCTLNNVFRKNLDVGVNPMRLNNGAPGQRFTVYLIQHSAPYTSTVNWDTVDPSGIVRWPGGVNHTMTVGLSGNTDILNFLCMGSELYYGTYDKDFTP